MPGTDVYVQDEAELSLFPTLTRMWMPRGRQKKVRAPGVHPPKRHECAATDWRTGDIARARGEKRDAQTFCRLLEACLARSARRKRRALLVTDRAKIHTPKGSRRVRELLEQYGPRLRLRYVPLYSPDCMPMEQLWNDWRKQVTHDHDRLHIEELIVIGRPAPTAEQVAYREPTTQRATPPRLVVIQNGERVGRSPGR